MLFDIFSFVFGAFCGDSLLSITVCAVMVVVRLARKDLNDVHNI